VFDANTVISAALSPNGTCRRALSVARARGSLALSDAVFGEIAQVLSRPSFASILTDNRREEILHLLEAAALWIEPKEIVADCRDAKDNCYLELALAARADIIISGDDDLLVLDPWRGIKVLRAARFLQEIGSG